MRFEGSMGKQRTVNSDSIDMDYRIIEYRCSSEDFFYALRSRIQKTEIVLDVGCGIRPQTFFEPKVHICVEPFEEYRKIIRPFFPNSGCFLFLKSDALTALKSFDDDSVDTVMMLDLIEHLEKDAGFELLREANRVARKQIVVFTPLGFFPMHFHGTATDDWGMLCRSINQDGCQMISVAPGSSMSVLIVMMPFCQRKRGKGKNIVL